MRRIRQLKLNTRSIFAKLLISFLVIILLFVSFNLFSLTFFRQSVRDELIKYNDTNMSNTTHDFEEYFQLLNSIIVNLYLNKNLRDSDSASIDYVAANHVIDDLRNTVSNPRFYLNNLFVYDINHSFILEKARGASPEAIFTQLYTNPNYTYDFWKREFAQKVFFKMYPAATFMEAPNLSPVSQTDLVFPLMIKSDFYPDYIMLAFIDANRLYKAFHQSINDNFYMLDNEGRPLFSSDSTSRHELPVLEPGKDWIKENGNYYFYKKGEVTGFTYVNIVPDAAISSQIFHLNLTLIALLVISVLISIAASVFFSMRFNNPVKKIVDSIRHFNEKNTLAKHTNEFELIKENIGFMLKSNQDAQMNLEKKTSLLRYYAYMNRLKRIHGDTDEIHASDDMNQPFRFVLFQLTFKMQFFQDISEEKERATYFIREYVNQAMGKELNDAHTFQIETDQILSIVHINDQTQQWMEVLNTIKHVLATDKEYIFFTIAVSDLYDHSSEQTSAYEQVVRLVKHRPFDDETRILYNEDVKEESFLLPGTLEQEINVNLQEGNDPLVLQTLRRVLKQMKKKEVSTPLFYRFAEEITDKVQRILYSLHLETNHVAGSAKSIRLMHTIEELEQYFEMMLNEAGQLIRLKKEERDPIVSFIVDYLQDHYSEDITLDLIAGKLNITGGYLSTYFKEKTGTNFVDFVNEFRIKQAVKLLLQTDMKIQDIALQAGYQTMSSFNRIFKKFLGVTPSEYRRNNIQLNERTSGF